MNMPHDSIPAVILIAERFTLGDLTYVEAVDALRELEVPDHEILEILYQTWMTAYGRRPEPLPS